MRQKTFKINYWGLALAEFWVGFELAGVVGSCPKDPVDVDSVEDVTPEAAQWSIWRKMEHFLFKKVFKLPHIFHQFGDDEF